MKHVIGVVGLPTQLWRNGPVPARDLAPTLVLGIQNAELMTQVHAFELAHSRVGRDIDVVVELGLTVKTQSADLRIKLGIVCRHRTAVTDGAEVFGRIERITLRTTWTHPNQRAMRLCCVFDGVDT
jgi:hypothetical protein